MTLPFKPREGKDRVYSRKLKRDDLASLRDKLPNEFRHVLDNYNHSNIDGIGYIDTNHYDHE
jgi:hypothetical protein